MPLPYRFALKILQKVQDFQGSCPPAGSGSPARSPTAPPTAPRLGAELITVHATVGMVAMDILLQGPAGDPRPLTLEADGQPLATDLRMSYLSENLVLLFQAVVNGKFGNNSFHPPGDGQPASASTLNFQPLAHLSAAP
jgi:hypothetical protein